VVVGGPRPTSVASWLPQPNGSRTYRYLNRVRFTAPALGVDGNLRRDQYYGPGLRRYRLLLLFKAHPHPHYGKINTEFPR